MEQEVSSKLTASPVQCTSSESESEAEHLVFVYGTLRRGHKNQYVLTRRENGHAVYVGPARTCEKWPLVIGTRYNIPFVLYKPGFGHNILGEIYRVDNKMLKHLDWFEDSPAWYKRKRVFVNMIKGHRSSKDSSSGQDQSASSIPNQSNNDEVASETIVKNNTECWGYVLENFKEDLERQRYFADYDDAVKVYDYEKDLEDAEEPEDYLAIVTAETLK